MSLARNTQEAGNTLLEQEMLMKILPLYYVDLTWNDPFSLIQQSNTTLFKKNNNVSFNLPQQCCRGLLSSGR